MAPMPISFQEPVGRFRRKFGMKHQRLKLIIFCSNDSPGLILTYFTARSNFATWAFIWENVTVVDSLKIIESCDRELGLYSKLNG